MKTKLKISGLVLLIVGCLYFFLCSIVIFKTSFQLLCSDLTSSFLDYANLSNPILGLMLGVVITAFIQEKCQHNHFKTIFLSEQTNKSIIW